ncbi:MAG: hypothetical protein HKO01_07885 [Flaviramulus sp.]|nr:hypothetical protein [Flaviramulus sp.]NNC50435.1 hypothetical protein [Flaviramulus sp.]
MKSLKTLLTEKLNSSFVFIFDINKPDFSYNIDQNENLNSEIMVVNKSESVLTRSLQNLELINHLENCFLSKRLKYFPQDFLKGMEYNKYDAQINTIKASTFINLNAA